MTVTSIPSEKTFHIVNDLKVTVKVVDNPYNFRLEELFQMAARINKKRSFLFVSKVLGKHLAVNPKIPLLVGNLLAMRYMEVVHRYKDKRANELVEAIQEKKNIDRMFNSMQNERILLPSPTTFIGFAETATALGHAVFSSFENNAAYIHTTREQITERTSCVNFEEEHSHATSHRVYADDQHFFQNNNEVVLIDDEITTGKTAVNIIKTIKSEFPSKNIFTVISILDWRTSEDRELYRQLESELAITIHVVALVDGEISVSGQPALNEESVELIPEVHQEVDYHSLKELLEPEFFKHVTSLTISGNKNTSPYLNATGRFGLTSADDNKHAQQFKTIGKHLKERRKGKKTVVVGTGEFMYVPMQIASHMGTEIHFQSTTRSPIYQSSRKSYTIQNKLIFNSPENTDVVNYLYNIEPHQYDEIFIFIERMSSLSDASPLVEALKRTYIPFVTIVSMT